MGLILPKENLIFIHIPKTAGKSICSAFDDLYEKVSYWNYYNDTKVENAHLTANEIKRITGDFWDKAFKFTVVRNEYDRLVSFYHYGLRKQRPSPFDDFNHFIDYVVGKRDVTLHDTNTGWRFARFNCKHWVDEQLDLVIDFNNLSRSWEMVCEKIGRDVKLPHINKSNHEDWINYYSRDNINSIHEWSQQE